MALPLDPHLLNLFMVAAVILVLAPGPDSLLVLTRSVADGRDAGLVATIGITVGNVIQATLAALGISALIAASPTMFDVLRWAGGFYLAWIGAQSLIAGVRGWRRGRNGDGISETGHPKVQANLRVVFLQALLTNMLNPKVILFNLAFVPQFVAPALGQVALQTFLLVMIFSVLGCAYLIIVAALSAGVARRMLSNRRVKAALDTLAGVLFLGFAIRLFLTDRRFT